MLMKQKEYDQAYYVIKNSVVLLEKLIKFPNLKSTAACAKMLMNPVFMQNLKLLLLSYYNMVSLYPLLYISIGGSATENR